MNNPFSEKRRKIILGAGVLIILAVLSGLWGFGYQPYQVGAQTASPSPSASAENPIPPESLDNPDSWILPNLDYSNTRATTNSPINSSTVNQLGTAWAYPLTLATASCNPLIAGDIVFFQDLKSNVIALDINTGNVFWIKEYNLDNLGPNGPAIGYGFIFVNVGTDSVAGLDIRTGDQIWITKLSRTPTEGIDIQPVVYDRTVYVSTTAGGTKAGNVGGNIGTIYALDIMNGNIRWSFDTVDSNNLWGNPKVNSGGGCYFPPAIDTKSKMMFWGTANPAPFPGTDQFPNGSSRPGPNLYTNSMLALDHSTGKLQWFNQVRPHDLFNYSLAISPVLVSEKINGRTQDLVIGTGKTGRVYAFNRQTGKLLWETPVGMHQNDQLTELPQGTTRVYPGELGGVETTMAYADGVIYVAVDNMYIDVTPSTYTPGDISKTSGEMVAIQAATGKILWDKKFPALDIGAATVINDLVFTATLDGKIYALKRDTGDIVRTLDGAPGINGWAAVSQDTIVMLGGSNGNPAVVAFKLGAPQPSAVPSPTAPSAASPSSAPTPSASATP